MEKSVNMTRRNSLRQEKRAMRQTLLPAERQRVAELLAVRLMELYPIQQAERLMAFVSLADEIDLSLFIEHWLEQGRELWLPRVSEGQGLEAVPFRGWEQTSFSNFGVREPLGPAGEPRKLEIILVPGLVFDASGYRLGYGKAYYDRFLAGIPPHIFKCGVGYEFQVVDDIGPQPHDVPMDWIITEKSEIAVNMDFF